MTMTVRVSEVSYGKPYDPTKPRLAEPDEINDVMAMCKSLHRENGQFPLDEEKVRARMIAALSRTQGGIVGVIGEHHRIEAMMYLTLSQFWYTNEMHVEEIFSYVSPAHRRSPDVKPPFHRRPSHAILLVEWAKETADSLGLRLFIGIVSTIKTEAKVRLYRRLLGPPVGAYFIYGQNRQPAGNGTEH